MGYSCSNIYHIFPCKDQVVGNLKSSYNMTNDWKMILERKLPMQKFAGAFNFLVHDSSEKQQVWEPHVPFPSLQRCFLQSGKAVDLPPALLHYVQKHNQETKMIHLRKFEKTPAIAFIFSFTLRNYDLPCSPCRRFMCDRGQIFQYQLTNFLFTYLLLFKPVLFSLKQKKEI